MRGSLAAHQIDDEAWHCHFFKFILHHADELWKQAEEVRKRLAGDGD